MLRYSICSSRSRWGITIANSLQSQRSLFVVSSEKRNTAKKATKYKKPNVYQILDDHTDRIRKEDDVLYKKRLAELRSLTRSLSSGIRKEMESKKEMEKLDNIPLPSEIQRESTNLYNKIDPESSKAISSHLLIVPSTKIPDEIAERLGLALKYLVNGKNQNWRLVLQELSNGDGFKDLKRGIITKFIASIPQKDLAYLIPEIENLLLQAKVKPHPAMIHIFMKSIVHGTDLKDSSILEAYCELLKEFGPLSSHTFELMITAYGKCNQMKEINKTLAEMKKVGLLPNKKILSNLLATCVYKANNHNQAVQIFDSMKFFSETTKPGTKEYSDIIVSYVNNDAIEKALDLYQEMIKEGIEVNQNIMVALSKGCASRELFRYKAWDFMFEIQKHGWKPTLQTYEYILYLSSKDGDLTFSRALYSKLAELGSTTARSFSFLLLAYSKVSLASSSGYRPPLITFNEQGRIFRRNFLSESTVLDSKVLPFLPIEELTSKEQVLAESSAMWGYAILQTPTFINEKSTTTYLNIAAEVGNLEDFKDRYNVSTYLNEEGMTKTRTIEVEEDETEIREESCEPELKKTLIKSPLLQELENRNSIPKVARVSLTYDVALKAAAKFKDYTFAHQIWTERGSFRKTKNFRDLPRSERDKLDFQFAASMVLALTRMNLLSDALAIVLSTEYQFRWSWKELKHLNLAAIELGEETMVKTIRGIVNRAQIKFEGKLRRKDYKKYVLQRGY
ncbi:mitochondrial group I intron splicing factor CCM1 [Scheffersomyces coipomensis]|uniref:mitochondrial group I intron splicing factor CCM1 n=1 Tax=Scheffersomyces coipomensis TaxID=1788519 RepID=UPI00315DD910